MFFKMFLSFIIRILLITNHTMNFIILYSWIKRYIWLSKFTLLIFITGWSFTDIRVSKRIYYWYIMRNIMMDIMWNMMRNMMWNIMGNIVRNESLRYLLWNLLKNFLWNLLYKFLWYFLLNIFIYNWLNSLLRTVTCNSSIIIYINI